MVLGTSFSLIEFRVRVRQHSLSEYKLMQFLGNSASLIYLPFYLSKLHRQNLHHIVIKW